MTDAECGEIIAAINTGEIFKLPLEKLEKFAAAIATTNAYTHFSSKEFPHICETIRLSLALKTSEETTKKAREEKEITDAKRHKEIQANLTKLREPHWSVKPSFWMLAISVILGFMALCVAVLSLPQVQKRLFPDHKQPFENQQQQSVTQKQSEPATSSSKK